MNIQKKTRLVLDLVKQDNFKVGENWVLAQDICEINQGHSSFDHLHGLLYLIKGDIFTSNYWYRAAGENPVHEEPNSEWAHMYEVMTGNTPDIAI